MAARSEPASLVIADISGYTGYLAGVELDHAMDILADLIEETTRRELRTEVGEPALPVSAGRFLSEPVIRTGTTG